jgi:CRISPR-associated endonuclease Csn1
MTKHDFPYRLGLDVGSNSLGWFVVRLDGEGRPVGLGPGGVRIYPDGRDLQSKSSNAVTRRIARGARRRRDRYLKRRTNIMSLLVAHGLMPADLAERKALEALDPFELRLRALDQELPAYHVGRALFHLNQRRGFLSNRKTEKDDSESGAIKEAATRLQAAIEAAGARTLGEFLHWRHRERAPVRTRNRSTGAKAEYEFYPTRQLVEAEFNAIWEKQAQYHPAMTPAARVAIGGDRQVNSIFFQRELKQPPVGKCALDPAHDGGDAEGFRCPWAHPLAQRFRIWQEVRDLTIEHVGRKPVPISKEDGDKIALALLQNNKLSFDKIRSLLKLPSESRFKLESDKRAELKGDETAAKLSHKAMFGKAWRGVSLPRQIEIVERLLAEEDEACMVAWLSVEAGLDHMAAVRVARAFLPDGHCRLGLRAIRKLVPLMEAGNTKYQAEVAVYGKPDATGEVSPTGYLPYYGEWLPDDVLGSGDPHHPKEKRWGRFPNPTVHIGLGQLRRVANALIREYGPPAEIVVEMTRDFKLSPRQVSEVEKEQAENQRKNDARRADLAGLGQPVNARNLLKMRLWEELNPKDPLDRCCPYTGEKISIQRLLSEEVDIDHLIPFSLSWDDSAANKTVCMRYANRAKRKQTPFEVFGDSPEIDGRQYDWEQIAARAAGLPRNKRWRFRPDALKQFEAKGGFQARQLNETGWLARSAKQYLSAVTAPNKIWVLPGKLTALIRGKWGLNNLLPDHNYSDAKNRKDHRHHAIDAMVAALTDRSLLQRMASAYDEERERIEVPLPWETLRDDLDTRLKALIVSHKADHGIAAQLHEDTAYGAVKDPQREGANLVYRKDFRLLNENEVEKIRDHRLRDLVKAYVASEKAVGKDLKSALRSFAVRGDIPGVPNGIRHVRLLKPEKPEYLVSICDQAGKPYKSYSAGENAYVDIIEALDGKWWGKAITVFQANRANGAGGASSPTDPDARLVMRVCKGDLIALHRDGKRVVMRVHRLDAAANRFKLAGHNESGNLDQRHADTADPFRWLMASYSTLKTMRAERVRVDELGRVWRVQAQQPPAR